MESKKKDVNGRGLIWLREDLRFLDNPAIEVASQQNMIPIFFIALPENDQGRNRDHWYRESLLKFIHRIREKNGLFIIKKGDVLQNILELCNKYDIASVLWNRRYLKEDRTIDEQIKKGLRNKGINAESFQGNLLNEPWQIKNGKGEFYRVFTPYYKNVVTELENRIKLFKKYSIESKSFLLDERDINENERWVENLREKNSASIDFQSGEKAALKTLDDFINKNLLHYSEKRDFPYEQATSGLSPYLARGDIGIHYVWNAILNAMNEDNWNSATAYMRQLIWRDFAWHVAFFYPELDEKPYRKKFENFPWDGKPEWFQIWKDGQTGYSFIDAGMQELKTTGLMHNRPRMISASFLTKHMRIHWKKGMQYFEEQLLDHDKAINAFSWQWVAGSGMDAAPYFRIFNPVSQSKKFDSKGVYFNQYIHDTGDGLFGDDQYKNIAPFSGTWKNPVLDLRIEREKTLAAYHSLNENE